MGMSLNFPDVCKTPAPPAPFVPVPYPDMGMNMQSAPFSPFVNIAFMPATNMGTLKVMTSGDEAGAMGGLVTGVIKGPGKTTVGNPIVFVTGLPAECLLTPTSGNMMNAPVGAQIVPSVVNVLYTFADGPEAHASALDQAQLRSLGEVARGDGEAGDAARVDACWLSPGVARVRIGLFSSHADRDFFNALRQLGEDSVREVVLDLRGNPGGDAAAAIRLAASFLPAGSVVLRERDSDGDEEAIVARGEQSYPWPLSVWIDGGTASAAELVAAALQHHGRATVIGRPSYGKATAQQVVCLSDGATRYATVVEYLLPDSARIDGRGVTPDIAVVDP
jgi:carboxyl-terminal processing protease